MNKKDLTPKQAEIKAIEDLFAMNGYFTDAFGGNNGDDLCRMIANIKSDFTLLCGTELEERIYNAEQLWNKAEDHVQSLRLTMGTLEKTIETLEKENYDLRNKVTNILDEHLRYGGTIDLNEHYTQSEIISAKVRIGVALSSEEVAYVLPRL